MKKRETPKQFARAVTVALIESYLEGGQPYDDAFEEGKPKAWAARRAEALRDLADELGGKP